ncbi:hypothetical protein F2Q70_00029697 [Brassica cretica]|uniref:Uncharacterized protein n=1 Tax=Brassica cretica TaxID=69181 RepID=A0A8S9FHL3_BRACR|nr:hypothetical protein F2Q70_00029697 [Brassica cretica]KAF2551722.1 hypothetical protein F2Q68_00034162 [Brassica cretica]
MSGHTKEKIAVRNNAGKTTPAATAPMANAYANATVPEKNRKPSRNFSPQERSSSNQARSLSSDRARTRLGRYVATELQPSVATEHAHSSVATKQPSTHTAQWLRSDRARTRLVRYVATELSTRYIATCQTSNSLRSDLPGLKKILICILF